MKPLFPARGEEGLGVEVPSGATVPLGNYFRLDGRKRPYQVTLFRHLETGKLFEMRPFPARPSDRYPKRKGS